MRRLLGSVAVAFVLVTALSGCSVVKAIKAVHALVKGNAAINNLTKQLQQSENAKFDVTYETTGSPSSTVEYATDPPTDFAFISPAQNGNAASEVIQNSSGYYTCSQGSGSDSKWTCDKVAVASDDDIGAVFQVYTGAYWFGILDVYASVASALTNVKVAQSTKSVNGFSLQCVNITAPPGSGTTGSNSADSTGTWCITQQGLLGYVAANGDNQDVTEIKSYSGSPAASLFQPPAGATITTGATGATGSSTSSTTGNTGSTTTSTTGTTGSSTSSTTGATGSGGSTTTSSTTGTTGG
jgi:hypothetical protein